MPEYQHSKAPAPAPGHTNSFERKTVGRAQPGGGFVAVEEFAPVPETAPGGRFLTKHGQWVDAHGNAITGQPAAPALDARGPRYVTDTDAAAVKAAEQPEDQKAAAAYKAGVAAGTIRKRE